MYFLRIRSGSPQKLLLPSNWLRRTASTSQNGGNSVIRQLRELDVATANQIDRSLSGPAQIELRKLISLAEENQLSQSKEPAHLSWRTMRLIGLRSSVPFIGFGFVDNFLLILAGDYIDVTIGLSLGVSSMAAAGIGNIISDIAGLGMGGMIESVADRLGIPDPQLTPSQLQLKQTKWSHFTGCTIGLIIGCVLGMSPLLFIKTKEQYQLEEKDE